MYEVCFDDLYDDRYDLRDQYDQCLPTVESAIVALIEELYDSSRVNPPIIAKALNSLIMEYQLSEPTVEEKEVRFDYVDTMNMLRPKNVIRIESSVNAAKILIDQLLSPAPLNEDVVADALVRLAQRYEINCHSVLLYPLNIQKPRYV